MTHHTFLTLEQYLIEAVLLWTAPPPAWNQTNQGASLADIQTAVYQVQNGSTVTLKWNYTLLPGQSLRLTTFSNDDYKELYSIYSTSPFSNLTIKKVTEQENATFQCKLLVGADV